MPRHEVGRMDIVQQPRIHETAHSVEDPRFQAAVSAVVGAFGDPTRREIYLFARDNDGVTANQVAESFALHPNVARHHLDKLVAGGYLDVYLEKPRSGGAGRPSKMYKGASVPMEPEVGSRRDELLSLLLSAAIVLIEPREAEKMAEAVGEAYGTKLAEHMQPQLAQRSIKFAMRAIADALTAHGFAARQSDSLGSLTVVSDNCPFGQAASENPVICALDRGLVRGMLATIVNHKVDVTLTSRAKGDASCAVSV